MRSCFGTPLLRICAVLFLSAGLFTTGARKPGLIMQGMKVACVQLDVTADLNENAERIIRHLEVEARQKVRLVVFPECALSSYDVGIIGRLAPARIEAALDRIGAACRKFNINAVVGTAFGRDGKWYNGACVIDPQGRIIKRYAKMHVVKPFFTNGDELAVFRIDGVPATIMICHDERFPEIFRIPVLAGARIGIYISSESKRLSKRNDYRSQIVARATENRISVIQCNAGEGGPGGGSYGHSRVIDAGGNILAEAGSRRGEVVRAMIRPAQSPVEWVPGRAEIPSLRQFWEEGLRVLRLQNPDYFQHAPTGSPAVLPGSPK